MIRVHDNKQNLNTSVVLTTINCDGIYRYWNADNIDELHRWWWDENYDGPSGDDEVVEFTINGAEGRGNIKCFEDIVTEYGFNKEVEVGELEFKIEKGTLEYADLHTK